MIDSHQTMRDIAFVEQLLAELKANKSFALATIMASRGSMPRHAPARMAYLSDGSYIGTVGGGAIERMSQERLVEVLAGTQQPAYEWYTHAKTGMACGGDALVSFRRFEPSDAALLEALLGRIKEQEHFVLREDYSDAAHPTFELRALDELDPADPMFQAQDPMWDEEHQVFCEPLGPDPVAYLFGGGHVGQALCPVLAGVGFRVVVFDDRPDIVNSDLFPRAERVELGSFQNIGEKVSPTSRDYVVVLTHGHAGDIDVLEQVAPVRPAYVGCIGSRGKAKFARNTLVERGVDRAWCESVHLPIGADILAVTPSEIAISIAAEMIKCRAELRPNKPHQH